MTRLQPTKTLRDAILDIADEKKAKSAWSIKKPLDWDRAKTNMAS